MMPRVVELLLQYGADLTVVDKAGMTPLETAMSSGASKEIIMMLRRPG